MPDNIVTILCSGVALGVYVPGLLLGENIRKYGPQYDVAVIESLFYDYKQEKVLVNKKAFHSSFRVALTGQKLSNGMKDNVDPEKKRILFEQWKEEARQNFIILTGFWVNLLEEYLENAGLSKDGVNITAFHMDADISASWRTVQSKLDGYKNIWMFSYKENKMNLTIGVEDDGTLPYSLRSDRYVIHGGGWGMGTYMDKMKYFEERGMKLDVILYDLNEFRNNTNNRQFILDPGWIPWKKGPKGRHEFPRFGWVHSLECIEYYDQDHHGVYDLIKNAGAIISKPGGGTLLDSFNAAIPVIILESFGDYEDRNSMLWQSLGYGITLDRFIESGCSISLLQKMHENILKDKGQIQEYGRIYAAENCII